MRDLVADLEGWLATGERITLARVVHLDRSGPRLPGATMAVNDDGDVGGQV